MLCLAQAAIGALLLASQASSTCFNPEPARQICYDTEGATPQDLDPREVDFTAQYLRNYGETADTAGHSPFWVMKVTDADNCAEWQVTSKGSTWVMGKLVGDADVAVAFVDIANTIDGGVDATEEEQAGALMGCGAAGGQMGVAVNASNPLYESEEFVSGGFTNEGIIIKLVRNPDA